jgi:hypothetical protein
MKTKDLTGKRYGNLTVIKPGLPNGYWVARCDCGNEKTIRGASMTSGNTKSCGCLTRLNPGRPRKPKYEPHIPLGAIVSETFEHMTPVRDALARRGVIVTNKGELRYNGITEHYSDPYTALAHALLKTVIVPDELKQKPIKS